MGAGEEREENAALPIDQADPDLPVRFVPELVGDRLPGDEGLDDPGPVVPLVEHGQRQDGDGAELRHPERLALIEHAVAR